MINIEIADEFKDLGSSTGKLFTSLYTTNESENVSSNIQELKDKLFKITNMIGDLTNNNDEIEKLGDLVEKELSSMDKAIEEVSRIISYFNNKTQTHSILFRLLKKLLKCYNKQKQLIQD